MTGEHWYIVLIISHRFGEEAINNFLEKEGPILEDDWGYHLPSIYIQATIRSYKTSLSVWKHDKRNYYKSAANLTNTLEGAFNRFQFLQINPNGKDK